MDGDSVVLLGMSLFFFLVARRQQQQAEERLYGRFVPKLTLSAAGRVRHVEPFGEYVLRQLGLHGGGAAAMLADAAAAFLAGSGGLADAAEQAEDAWLQAAAAELEAASVSYLAFHWRQLAAVVEFAATSACGPRLRRLVAAATRSTRFERALRSLRAKRAFSTLVEELRRLRGGPGGGCVVAAQPSDRPPVLLLVGGGMGAGKSTAVAEMVKRSAFWTSAGRDAVVVEADAFKESDVVYRAISDMQRAGDVAEASQLVHQSSTQAASSLLVTALNEGRDVIFDGTMSWEPFVTQTVAMARDVHQRRYRLGPGYVRQADGAVTEQYWEVDGGSESNGVNRRGYRIEMVGVTCDPLLAVVRGARRALATGRSVPVNGQLRSHKLFAASLERYIAMVDEARVYSTNRVGAPPELIAWKDGLGARLLVDPQAFARVKQIAELRPDADSFLELYGAGGMQQLCEWNEIVLHPEREQRKELIRRAIESAPDLRSLSMPNPGEEQQQGTLHHSISAPALRDNP